MARSTTTLAVACLLLSVFPVVALAAERPTAEWLQGSGKDLRLGLHGEVVDSNGRPATGLRVGGDINSRNGDQPLQASIEGNRFEIWIPVNQSIVGSVRLIAREADSNRVAYARLDEYQLRQAAIDGLKLTLKSPTRQVKIKVTDQGEPVSGATVKVVGIGFELRSTTGANGIAKFALLPKQEIYQLTAWTDDRRIGGFQFGQPPPRDPEVNEHVIELSKCRDQRMRFVAEDGSPVASVRFTVHVATPSPDVNYIGSADAFQMTTDIAGEAVCLWFPDWKEVHFYPEIKERNWILKQDRMIVDGVAVYTLKEHKPKPRKRIAGRVVSNETSTGLGGFYVCLESFQGEREYQGDHASAFSDPNGTFAVDILPDATYCAYVQDERWVGKIIDFVLYESSIDKLTAPELEIAEGQPVEVIVTSGPNRVPISNLSLNLDREHEYTWHQDDKLQRNSRGPRWTVTTDHFGKTTTRTLPGKLTVSVYTARWRTEKSIEVAAGKPTHVALHREIDEKRTITGQLVVDADGRKNLDHAEVRVFSANDNYGDQQSLKSDAEGAFSFDTSATEVAIFARTRDGKAAGSIVTNKLDTPIQIGLQPTGQYHGRLLAAGGQPAVSHPIRAYVRLEGKGVNNARSAKIFDLKLSDTKTDQDGDYAFEGIPAQMRVRIEADAIDGGADELSIDEVYLGPNESRPRVVKRLSANEPANEKVPLADRYKNTLRDCALGGYRPMIIIADNSESTMNFVDRNYMDYDANNDVPSFVQLLVTGGTTPLDPADSAFLQEQGWLLPQPGRVFSCAIGADGKEIGRQEVELSETEAAEKVAKFIHQHALAPEDAEVKWTAAFAEAKRIDKRVWARISGRYCGPCFTMSSWLDDQREVIGTDYVMLKIDDVRDIRGKEVAERVYRGQEFGIPFHAIFDASGTLLIDSNGPVGNVGAANGIEGQKHLRKMLLDTRKNLSEEEIERLVVTTGE